MSSLKISSIVLIICSTLYPIKVKAEGEALRFRGPVKCENKDGLKLDLSPGRYIPEDTWNLIDHDWKRLENDNTRLKAENRSLKNINSFDYRVIAISVVTGLVGGYYIAVR